MKPAGGPNSPEGHTERRRLRFRERPPSRAQGQGRARRPCSTQLNFLSENTCEVLRPGPGPINALPHLAYKRPPRASAGVISTCHTESSLANFFGTSCGSGPVVRICEGRLRGRTLRTEGNTTYYSFQGIPYARPPLRELRFQAPRAPRKWHGIRDAGKEGPCCKQPKVRIRPLPRSWSFRDVAAFVAVMPNLFRRFTKMFCGSEDCLYLNVYTPELPSHADYIDLRPVLVWIHGGGFLVGDGDADVYGPDYFLEMGIVVVTINYRLGPFGFLAVGTEAAPGNAGLKDQVQALRWVKRSIANFGGDPNRVTLYGESAGAAAVHLHTLSPLSRGLFHGVIAGSGSALHDWAITNQQVSKARELARYLGIHTNNEDRLVNALKRESSDRILTGLLSMRNQERFVGNELAFLPVVEPDLPGAFLCEDPASILRRGGQAPVPMMTGANSREGLLWLIGNPTSNRHNPESDAEMAKLNKRLVDQPFLSDFMFNAMSPVDREECHFEIMQCYFGFKKLSKETLSKFIDLFGDICFINPLYDVTKAHATRRSPVYVYHMSFDGNLGFFKRLLGLKHYPGVAHSDELGYLFRVRVLPDTPISPEDDLHRRRLLKLWSNFIHTGNPTPDDGASLGVLWTPTWRRNQMNFLEIGETLYMRKDPPNERMIFWDSIYHRYLGRPLIS
ncbi:esterase FE4-like isoform X2 [Thrips palmi]|nr:esterase FE4-like isoform X2 [Thrips palmi]